MDRYLFPSDLLNLMGIGGRDKKTPYMSFFTDSFLSIIIPPRTATGFEDVTVKEAIQNYSHFMTPKNTSRDASLTEEQASALSSAIKKGIEAGEEVFQALAVRNTENAATLHSKGLEGLDAPAYEEAFCEKVGAECLCDAVKEDLKLAVSESDKFLVILLYSLFQNHYQATICPLIRINLRNKQKSTKLDKQKYDAYYRSVIRGFEQEEKETIVGSEALATAYIEPYTEILERYEVRQRRMMEVVEKWFTKEKSGVLLLHGQPGDGKTTFCKKAVYEYAKQRRFISANGVFCFTLNDAESHLIDGADINLERTFHRERMHDQLLTYEDCRGMLIFLDGYDEVKMLLNSTQYSSFDKFYDYVKEKASEFDIHFVITTRTVAVEEVLQSYSNIAQQFLPLSFEQQKAWALDERRRNRSVCVEMLQSGGCSTYGQYWEQHLEEICHKKPTKETSKAFYELLQIPFIFRMVVHQAYDFNGSVRNKAKLYEDLFVRTIKRRTLKGITGKENQKKEKELEKELLELYKELAYSIWCHDDAMTPYDRKERDLLLFSYFMTGKENFDEKEKAAEDKSTGKRKRKPRKSKQAMIGFLHRSIYQYFLALYLYSKLEEVAEDMEQASEKANALLEGLGSRLLEKDVLLMVTQIAENKMAEEMVDEEEVLDSCKVVFESLVAEEGVFSVPEEVRNLETTKLRKRERGNNIFCNAMNLCFCVDAVEEFNACEGIGRLFEENQKLRLYISGHEDAYINLNNLKLVGANMEESIFSYVDFSGSDLSGSNLRYAELTGSSFDHCNLRHTDMNSCCLHGANLRNADLSDADLQRADLSSAIAASCSFRRSDLLFADLEDTVLRDAAFADAKLLGTRPSANVLFDSQEKEIPWTNFEGYLSAPYDFSKDPVYQTGGDFLGTYKFGKYPMGYPGSEGKQGTSDIAEDIGCDSV